jgi:hypothetical protein
LDVNEGVVLAAADEAVFVAAYFGDATRSGTYSGLDAQRIARVCVGPDDGFEEFPTVDPLIIGDITGKAGMTGLDAQRVAMEAVGLDAPEIPPLPPPLRLDTRSVTADSADTDSPSQLPTAVDIAPAGIINREEYAVAALDQVFSQTVAPMTNPRDVAHDGRPGSDVDAALAGWLADSRPRSIPKFAPQSENSSFLALGRNHRLGSMIPPADAPFEPTRAFFGPGQPSQNAVDDEPVPRVRHARHVAGSLLGSRFALDELFTEDKVGLEAIDASFAGF